jgi:hypothetical protein
MIKQIFATKLGSAAVVAASLVIAGTVASASADSSNMDRHLGDDHSGYSKDQCKDGGWRTFKNADGSMKFKNQGQCIKFFATGENNGGRNDHHPHFSFGQIWSLFLAFISWLGGHFGNFGNLGRL